MCTIHLWNLLNNCCTSRLFCTRQQGAGVQTTSFSAGLNIYQLQVSHCETRLQAKRDLPRRGSYKYNIIRSDTSSSGATVALHTSSKCHLGSKSVYSQHHPANLLDLIGWVGAFPSFWVPPQQSRASLTPVIYLTTTHQSSRSSLESAWTCFLW